MVAFSRQLQQSLGCSSLRLAAAAAVTPAAAAAQPGDHGDSGCAYSVSILRQGPHWHPESRRDPKPYLPYRRIPSDTAVSQSSAAVGSMPEGSNSDRQALKQLMGPK